MVLHGETGVQSSGTGVPVHMRRYDDTGGSPGSCADGVVSGKGGGVPMEMSGPSAGLLAPGERKTRATSTKSPNPRPRPIVQLAGGVGGDAKGTQGHVRTGCGSVWCVDMVMANGPRINVCLGL